MSLKGFHILFILACIAFGLGFSGWCFRELNYSDFWYLRPFGIVSFGSALALGGYLFWFVKKSRPLVALAPFLFLSERAFGCAVCYADPNSLMAKSTNNGILFLLVVVCLVLFVFAWTFIRWSRRDRCHNELKQAS